MKQTQLWTRVTWAETTVSGTIRPLYAPVDFTQQRDYPCKTLLLQAAAFLPTGSTSTAGSNNGTTGSIPSMLSVRGVISKASSRNRLRPTGKTVE